MANHTLEFEIQQQRHWQKAHYRQPQDPVVEAYALPKIKFISTKIQLNGMSILDVGCGNGVFTYYLSKLTKVFGVDSSFMMLNKNPCRPLVATEAEYLPFKNSSFDVVFEANLLHHTMHPQKIIDEIYRVSKRHIVLLEQNNLNPIMFLFSLIVNGERGGLKFNKKYLRHLSSGRRLKEIGSTTTGMISQNNTPRFLVPLLRLFDRDFLFGEYVILIFEKI